MGSLSIDSFMDGAKGGVACGRRHVLIMDEVDGMAGNADRGGMQVSYNYYHTCCALLCYSYHSTKINLLCIWLINEECKNTMVD